MATEELESDVLSSDDDESPLQDMALESTLILKITVQCDFWSHYAIGFLLDYQKFSVSYLQHIINIA